MNTKTDRLGNDLGTDLAAVRLAVGKLNAAHLPWDAENPIDLVNQSDRMVRCYEKWLLDDEQRQMLSVQPGAKFILYASTYLCDIGLTDGQELPPFAKEYKDDRTPTFFNQSLLTRSCRMIHDRWQDLCIPEEQFVSITTQVCRHAGTPDDANFSSAESETIVKDKATVNVPLLTAYLQLCMAIDL